MESMTEDRAVPSLYVVDCPSCKGELPVHAASWCHCVAKRISPVCPNCGVCLCKASDAAQRQFWSAAPAWVKESRAAEQRRRTAATGHGTQRQIVDVMIVDDDEEIRLMAAFNLDQLGYTVAVADGPHEALETLQSVHPRIVITDALMPKMDGRELCQRIKAQQPDIKVVVMTSLYTAPRYKSEAFKTFGADEYLVKPIDFNELRQVMAKLEGAA